MGGVLSIEHLFMIQNHARASKNFKDSIVLETVENPVS